MLLPSAFSRRSSCDSIFQVLTPSLVAHLHGEQQPQPGGEEPRHGGASSSALSPCSFLRSHSHSWLADTSFLGEAASLLSPCWTHSCSCPRVPPRLSWAGSAHGVVSSEPPGIGNSQAAPPSPSCFSPLLAVELLLQGFISLLFPVESECTVLEGSSLEAQHTSSLGVFGLCEAEHWMVVCIQGKCLFATV